MDKAMYLYTGLDGRWWIGGEEVKAKQFQCSLGWIASTRPHKGALPGGSVSEWQRYEDGGYVADPRIAVVDASDAPSDKRDDSQAQELKMKLLARDGDGDGFVTSKDFKE